MAGRNAANNTEHDHDKQKSSKKDGPTSTTDDHHGSSPGAISDAPSGMFSSKHQFELLLIFIFIMAVILTALDFCELNLPYASNCHLLGLEVVLHSS